MRVALITNIPSPYRNPVYAALPQDQFTVVFCAQAEPNRLWRLPPPTFAHRFLKERLSSRADGFNFVHNNPDVWPLLDELRPEVVITSGINPTHLYAFAWSKLHRIPHVYMTDGTVVSEAPLSATHRQLRRLVLRFSATAVVASRSGRELIQGYGMAPDRIFYSRLCADNARFAPRPLGERDHDVMFCGQLHERKLPKLFVDVCAALRARRGHCRALVIGDGPERARVLAALHGAGVDVTWPGFVQPEDLPGWYPRARLFLFTTRLDPWGVVANEAMAAGTPVLTTPSAGVAGDLVVDGRNGRVLPAQPTPWIEACLQLLDDPAAWTRLSTHALEDVGGFQFDSAAQGLVAACRAARGQA